MARSSRSVAIVRHVRVLPLLAAAALVASCGSSSSKSPSGSGSSSGSSDTITIKDFQFSEAKVPAGATVKVTNEDSAAHNVDADNGAFQTPNVAQGETVTFTAPKTPGDYDYICSIHTYMKGTLVVTAAK
jgi:plastocyanin